MRKVYLALAVFLLDQLSKQALLYFSSQTAIFNQGIAFGFLPSDIWLVIIYLIIVFLFLYKRNYWPTWLIIGGGMSNLFDRFFRGAVLDFIDIKIVPIFNLADVFICLGVVILLSRGWFNVKAENYI